MTKTNKTPKTPKNVNKNTKSAKTSKTSKTDPKTDPKTESKTDPRVVAKTDHFADNQTVLNTSKSVPVDIKKTDKNADESPIVYHIAQVEYADGTIIHKQFRVDKMPTHAVLVKYSDPKKLGALDAHHVLTYSRSEKLCQSHARRIRKQYVGSDATIEQRYTGEIEIVAVRDLGMATSEIDPNFVENRSWERAKNAAAKIALAAKNPNAVTAAAVALNTAVLTNYIS